MTACLQGCDGRWAGQAADVPSEEHFDRREDKARKHDRDRDEGAKDGEAKDEGDAHDSTTHDSTKHHAEKSTHGHTALADEPRWYITMHGKPAGNTVHGIAKDGTLLGSVLATVPESAGGKAQGVRGMLHTGKHGLLLVSANMADTRILWYGSPDAQGILPFESVFAMKRLANPEMVHSYALAVGIDGTVYASNQDSDTVTGYCGIGTPTPGHPVAVPAEIAGLGLPPGTIVPRAGVSPQGITQIRGIATGADGLLYIADRGAGQVLAFNPKTGLRTAVIADAQHGLKRPIQLLFAPDGETLYISDNGVPGIFRVNVRTGEFILFANARTGCPELPSSLALDDTHLFVGDRKRNQIIRFTLDTGERSKKPFVAELPDAPEFMIPASVLRAVPAPHEPAARAPASHSPVSPPG